MLKEQDRAGISGASTLHEALEHAGVLRDEHATRESWTAWSKGTEESGIPALEKLARLKEKRLEGPVAHAIHPISTGQAGRLQTGSRSPRGSAMATGMETLIRYISISSIRCKSHKKTRRAIKKELRFSGVLLIMLRGITHQ